MSDTSIISTRSDDDDLRRSRFIDHERDEERQRSSCQRHWFSLVAGLLSVLLVLLSLALIFILNKHAERDRRRQQIKQEFKRQNQVADRVLDMIMKNGIVFKWIQLQKGPLATILRDLVTDIVQTLFGE